MLNETTTAAEPTLAQITRSFLYNGRTLPDPDPALSPNEVKSFYAGIHPELLNASIEGGDFDGDRQLFVFQRGIGTKG